VLLVPIAVGGTPIDWWAGGSVFPYAQCGVLLDRALGALQSRGLADKATVLWHQGETDHGHARAYTGSFLRMRARVDALGGGVRWVVAQASRCGARGPDPELLHVQGKLATLPGVFAGPNTDLLGADMRFDDCHFSAPGLDAHASAWLERVAPLLT
jgi:hypothetical protein